MFSHQWNKRPTSCFPPLPCPVHSPVCCSCWAHLCRGLGIWEWPLQWRGSLPPALPSPLLCCPSCWHGRMAYRPVGSWTAGSPGSAIVWSTCFSGASLRNDSSGHPVSDVECPNSVNCFHPVLPPPSLQDMGSGRGAQSGGASRGTVTGDGKA